MATQEDIDKLVSTIQSLKNRDLVNICVVNHLAKSGNKADLQKRIIHLIDSAYQDPNPHKFLEIQSSILSFGPGSSSVNYRVPTFASSLPSSPSYLPSGMSSPYSNGNGNSNALNRNGAYSGSPGYGGELGQRMPPNGHAGLHFKSSPFYEIDTQLGDVRQCEAMAQHRNSVSVQIRASLYPELQRCLSDSSLRVMIFCAASNVGVQDIAFPYQCEIKINGGEVKANLRGLKNKPGSTRPVDITSLLRLKPSNYSNTLEFTYALTAKRFYLVLYICKSHTAAELTSMIERRGRITKSSVVREVTKQAQDPDIVATSQVLSLKCPLTYMRLSLPIRSTTCKHIQCFDATSYLQLQEQGPQWLCPVCSRAAPFETLAVDEYVKEILANTPGEQDQVTIDPDGTWHAEKHKNGDAPSTPKGADTSLLNDEDEPALSFSAQSADGVRDSLGRASAASAAAYRDSTATPVHAGTKRQREVIDLTLSDDDDDANPPPMKRQHIVSNGLSPAPLSTI